MNQKRQHRIEQQLIARGLTPEDAAIIAPKRHALRMIQTAEEMHTGLHCVHAIEECCGTEEVIPIGMEPTIHEAIMLLERDGRDGYIFPWEEIWCGSVAETEGPECWVNNIGPDTPEGWGSCLP